MLTEFALTPQVFDHRCNMHANDWANSIRDLRSVMFPSPGGSAVIVSDLSAGTWHDSVVALVEELDQKSKYLAQSLLTKLKGNLVSRPACIQYQISGEEDWLKEAITSHERFAPIDRIVATAKTVATRNDLGGVLCAPSNLLVRGGWKSSGLIPMSLNQQMNLLRPMYLHARYLALVLPRLVKTEIKFACRLIRERVAPSSMLGSVQVDLHTAYLGGDKSDEQLCDRLKQELGNLGDGCSRLRLIVWPSGDDVLDREILGGFPSELPAGFDGFAYRWGGSLAHVATDESPEAGDTNWHVYTLEDLVSRYNRFYQTRVRPNIRTINL